MSASRPTSDKDGNDLTSSRLLETITEEEMGSGAWLDEPATIALTKIGPRALEGRRKRGSLTFKPRYITSRGGREFWYLRSELERLLPATSRHGDTTASAPSSKTANESIRFGAELELLMARAEAKEAELELLRYQLRSTQDEVRRLRSLLATQLNALATYVDSDTPSTRVNDA